MPAIRRAWLMPLLGDAVIGIPGLLVAFLIAKKTGRWVWASVLISNSVAMWDALSAYVISTGNPWPEFFMLRLLVPSMFFAASAMHLVIIFLVPVGMCRGGCDVDTLTP